MIISFFGHRDANFSSELKTNLDNILENEIKENDVTFYLGRYGNFDSLARECCEKYREKHRNCKLIFVTPYLDENYFKNKNLTMFDEILYPNLENCPRRFAIIRRNYWVIENSDLIILYVCNHLGNCSKLFEHIVRKKKRYINLAEK